jgi:DNA-binding NtrC family response regulator
MSRILLVDDEPMVLQLLRRYLERQGYEVEVCDSGEAAVLAFKRDPTFDFVMADLTLPGIDGAQLIEQIRAIHPTVPALIASGYPYEPQLQGVGFLQKPFLPQMLADYIATALKKPEGG